MSINAPRAGSKVDSPDCRTERTDVDVERASAANLSVAGDRGALIWGVRLRAMRVTGKRALRLWAQGPRAEGPRASAGLVSKYA
jgi:hypothetical protein